MAIIPVPALGPFRWADASAAYRSPISISAARQDTGLQDGDPADPLLFNSLLGNDADWLLCLAGMASGTGVWAVSTLNITNPTGPVVYGTIDYSGTVLRITAPAAASEMRFTVSSDPITFIGGTNFAVSSAGILTISSYFLGFGSFLQDDPTTGIRYGYGVDRPGLVWDLSPVCGGWTASRTASSVDVAVHIGGPGVGAAKLENQSGGAQNLWAQCPLRRALDNTEVVATYTDTCTALVVIFADDNTEQPTVELIRQTMTEATTEVVMFSCTPTAVASEQTITDSTPDGTTNGRLEWGTYRYLLRWTGGNIADTAFSRGIVSVRLSVTPDAIY